MNKFLSLLVFLPAIASGQPTSLETTGKHLQSSAQTWSTLNDSIFSIQYPQSWELNQEEAMGTRFILFSPAESEDDAFRENVNLLLQDVSGLQLDLATFTELSLDQLKIMFNAFHLIENQRLKKGKLEYQKLMYTAEQGMFQLQFEQYYWVIGDAAYVLTFTSEENKFADYMETSEKILNSFSIRK